MKVICNVPNVYKAIAFLQKDWRVAVSYKLQFFSSIFGVLITTMVFYFLSDFLGQNLPKTIHQYGGNYFAFIIVGIALADYLIVSTDSFSNAIRSGQVNGTFEALLVTPTSILTILFSSYLYPFLFTTFRISTYIILGILFCGVKFKIYNLWLCLFALVMTLLPFWGLGLLSAAFIIVFKQGSPISWLMGISSTLLGGVLYPVSSLPNWLEPFSYMMPLTYGIEAMRKVLLANATFGAVRNEMIVLFCFSVVLLATGIVSVKYSLKLARRQGTLLHF
jgi:ABC-2 type transport system permease protein